MSHEKQMKLYFSSPLPVNLYPHALCWYNHIKFYEKKMDTLSGVKQALGRNGPANVEPRESRTINSKDDDTDLFGSDDDEKSEETKSAKNAIHSVSQRKKNENLHCLLFY